MARADAALMSSSNALLCCYRIRPGLESASQSSPTLSLVSRRADNGPIANAMKSYNEDGRLAERR
jgi:hypothetical protein